MSRIAAGLLVLGLFVFAAGGCGETTADEGRAILAKAGPASSIQLGTLWHRIAESGGFDPSNTTLESLWLEYSRSGTLVSASIQAFTDKGQLVQVGFTGGDVPSDDGVLVSGVIASTSQTPVSVTASPTALFQGIDMVDPTSIIALLGPTGPEDRFTITSAPVKGDTGKSISASARVYCWSGDGFTTVPRADERRMYGSEYTYLAAYSATITSSDITHATTVTSVLQSSGQAVYFLIPRAVL